MHDIARNLKCLRRQRGLTQEELAARLHVTRQAVSNWERNRNLPELEILLSAAELLGVGVDELLYGPRPAEGAAAPANRRRRTVTAGALWAVWAALWLAYQLWALPALEAMYDKYDYSAAGWLLLWPALAGAPPPAAGTPACPVLGGGGLRGPASSGRAAVACARGPCGPS